MQVAIAACRTTPDAPDDEVFHDDDNAVLAAALVEAGATVEIVVWDHRTTDWGRFDAVVLRSTWDSVDRPDDFLRWVRAVRTVTTVLNPPEAIAWNLDKTYLRALAARGVPVVPTAWITDGTVARWSAPASEIVVKPSISGGGRETARHAADRGDEARAHIGRLLDRGHTVMVQPYLASVETEGELKLVFIGGDLSHAVRVGPSLRPGEGVRERPWERTVTVEATDPAPAQLALAQQILSIASAGIPAPLTYARVDLIAAESGEPLLAELELVDPSLFLALAPTSADRLAATIVRQAHALAAD